MIIEMSAGGEVRDADQLMIKCHVCKKKMRGPGNKKKNKFIIKWYFVCRNGEQVVENKHRGAS